MKVLLSQWIKNEYAPGSRPDPRTVKKHAKNLGVKIVREMGKDYVVLDDVQDNPILKAYATA